MTRSTWLTVGVVTCAMAFFIHHAAPQPVGQTEGGLPVVGPRGPAGPDVPLSEVEREQFAQRVSVEGRTAAAVQAACERGLQQGVPVVFLPAGEYVFATTVKVPGGLTLLGAGSASVIRTASRDTRLFEVGGDRVRFTRLRLEGADTSTSESNDTYGIAAYTAQNVRIDHCELLGFSYATTFGNDATAQLDHCKIHDNLRDGLGYGTAIYSGAYVLVMDNEFSQCRHSLASNGTLDWSSPERLGKYVHKPGRLAHWEFIHNLVGSNDKSHYELMAVDTHPGMDGSFVVEGNLFENLRHGIGIRDGSGLIQANLFRNLRTVTTFRPCVAISIAAGAHNGIPVEGCMPHDIQIAENTFLNDSEPAFADGVVFDSAGAQRAIKYSLGQAESIVIDGRLVPETQTVREAKPPLLRLEEMGTDGVLRWHEMPPQASGTGRVTGSVTDDAGRAVEGARVLVGDRATTTGTDGSFAFAEVTGAARFLVVLKSGFDLALHGLRVQPERTSRTEVRLAPDHNAPALLP